MSVNKDMSEPRPASSPAAPSRQQLLAAVNRLITAKQSGQDADQVAAMEELARLVGSAQAEDVDHLSLSQQMERVTSGKLFC